MLSDQTVQMGINSEIHASLRRLEDADYANNLIRDEEINTLVSQANEANSNLQSQIDHLTSEVYQLHSYIEPHIYQGDLCYFQTIYIGNLQVSNGGHISGTVLFDGNVTMGALLNANNGLDVLNGITADTITINGDSSGGLYINDGSLIVDNDDIFDPHTLSIEGVMSPGKIYATQDMSFSLAGLASGGWSGATYGVYTNINHTNLGSTTVDTTLNIVYDSTSHEYKVTAYTKDEGGIIRDSVGPVGSGTQAYTDGGYPPNSATFMWYETVNGEAHFKRTDGDTFGRTSRTVYWDDD